MQKIYTFRVSRMNGTVTMSTHVEACASRVLAEQVREAVIKANEHNDTLVGMPLWFSDIEELTLWESADEVPVLNPKPKTREQLEQEREECARSLNKLRDALSAEYAKAYVRGILNEQIEKEERRLKDIEEELAALDGSPAPPVGVDKSIVIEYPVPIEQEEVDFLKGLVRKHMDSVRPAKTMHDEWIRKYGHRYGKGVQATDVIIKHLCDGRTRVSFLAPLWDIKTEDGV